MTALTNSQTAKMNLASALHILEGAPDELSLFAALMKDKARADEAERTLELLWFARLRLALALRARWSIFICSL